jgi:hypothetical protein
MKLRPSSSWYRISLIAALLMLFSTPSFAQWTTSGTNIYNSNSGNVGIGITNPIAKFQVVGEIRASGILRAAGNEIRFSENRGLDYDAATNAIYYHDANSRVAKLGDIGGNAWFQGSVGIGTETPGAKLDVNGDARLAGSLTLNNGSLTRNSWSAGSAISNQVLLNVWDNDVNGSGGATHAGIRWSHDAGSFHTKLHLYGHNGSSDFNVLTVTGHQRVGINTVNPQNALDVNGTARAKEVIVTQTGWADFVFDEGYDLPTLAEVEAYIEEHGHLSNIPSAAEVETGGVRLGEIQAKLLQKIEELTLYIIAQEKRAAEQQQEIEALKDQLGQ